MQEKAWFTVGEEKGEEDKAGEMRAQTMSPAEPPPAPGRHRGASPAPPPMLAV